MVMAGLLLHRLNPSKWSEEKMDTSMPTELGIKGPMTSLPMKEPSPRYQFSIFHTSITITPPVVILQRHPSKAVVLARKLIFSDKTEIVICTEMRSLWMGNGEAAFDQDPSRVWRIAAITRNGIVTTDGIIAKQPVSINGYSRHR